jgi:hypothetical protein
MPRSALRLFLASAVLAAFAAVPRRVASAPVPSVVAIAQLDVGYRLGSGGLKIRASLVNGEAFEYETSQTSDVQMILATTQACGSGSGAGMTAVVEERSFSGRALTAIQCSLRPAFTVARP